MSLGKLELDDQTKPLGEFLEAKDGIVSLAGVPADIVRRVIGIRGMGREDVIRTINILSRKKEEHKPGA